MAPRHKRIRIATGIESVADKATKWIGSPASIIVHTFVFVLAFGFVYFGTPLEKVLLVLTTAVSLEAIYLALFIQMSVNKNTQSLADVEEDIEEIAEDVEGIEKDIEEIAEDVEGIEKDIDEIQVDVDEMEKDIDKIEEVEQKDNLHDQATMQTLSALQQNMQQIMDELQNLKEQKK